MKQVLAKAALEAVGNKAIACTAVWEAHLEGKELEVFCLQHSLGTLENKRGFVAQTQPWCHL